jgi:hypothetical protein
MATNKKQNRINTTNEERAEQGRQAVKECAGTKEDELAELVKDIAARWDKDDQKDNPELGDRLDAALKKLRDNQ